MADTSSSDPRTPNEQNTGQNGSADPGQQPRLQIAAQYIKDFSFENPNAPDSLVSGQSNPSINVSVDVQAKRRSEEEYESDLKISVNASRDDGSVVFIVELVYGGVFRLSNIPNNQIQPVILIECPRLLFPFARRILADATRDGGFPPLMLDPIDFAALYQQQMQAQAADEKPPEASSDPVT